MRQIQLTKLWEITNDMVGEGGFGSVFIAKSGKDVAVAKLIRKAPGAQRETLFADMQIAKDKRNIIPVLDYGETDTEFVIIMPRAERSLHDHLRTEGGALTVPETVSILLDIAEALVDLEGEVVHRDIKPKNVLLFEGKWCLSDFGIARYAEATTAIDTFKHSGTAQYVAPERWRQERATTASDVYSVGIMAFEMLYGEVPFLGDQADIRDQHLNSTPPELKGFPANLASLIAECLYKPAQARPSPENLIARLKKIQSTPAGGGLSRLQIAHHKEVQLQANTYLEESRERTEAEARNALFKVAEKALHDMYEELTEAILGAAPSAVDFLHPGSARRAIALGTGTLLLHRVEQLTKDGWGRSGFSPPFAVIAAASISVEMPLDNDGYSGRSHSLWYCDALKAGEFAWFETAFTRNPLMSGADPAENPFSLFPGDGAASALSGAMAEVQVAWPFTRLIPGDLDEFVQRWGDWFAEAATGELSRPNTINVPKVWRRG